MLNRYTMIASAMILGFGAASAHATFVQSTFNDLAPTLLDGQSGGTGDWASPWNSGTSLIRVGDSSTGNNKVDLVADPLTNFAILGGGAAQGGILPQSVDANTFNGIERRQQNRDVSGDGFVNTTWFTVLMQAESTNSRPGIGFNANYGVTYALKPPRITLDPNSIDTQPMKIFVHLPNPSGTDFGTSVYIPNLTPQIGDTVLILGKIEYDVDGVNDRITIWGNPDVENLGTPDYVSTDYFIGDWFGSGITNVSVSAFHTDSGARDNGLVDLLTVSDSANAYEDVTGVSYVEPLVGDLDRDGFVGLGDLDIVLGNWNTNVTAGDLAAGDPSGDGFVGLDDLDVILGNWNAGTPPTVVVPEPTAFALLSLGSLAMLRRK